MAQRKKGSTACNMQPLVAHTELLQLLWPVPSILLCCGKRMVHSQSVAITYSSRGIFRHTHEQQYLIVTVFVYYAHS